MARPASWTRTAPAPYVPRLRDPDRRGVGASLAWQRRQIDPRADPRRSRSDLGSAQACGREIRARGWSTLVGLEITSEGENRLQRRLVFVGTGNGAYDSLGNPVGQRGLRPDRSRPPPISTRSARSGDSAARADLAVRALGSLARLADRGELRERSAAAR